MAPLDFKHMTSAKYRPGEDDAVNYYAQKRKKQYHGNEGKEVKELSMKPDKKLPNLKVPVKGKKGISRFMRKKAISKAKDDLNASVQSADRKPEKYIKPDGKVGIRMVKTDKEVIKKEQMQVYRVGHKDMSGNVHATTPDDAMKKLRKKGLKGDIKLTHRGSARSMPTRIIPRREELDSKDKPFVKKLIGKLRKGSNTHAKQADDLEKAMKTEAVEYPHMMYDPKTGNEVKAKTPADHNKYAKMGYTHEKPKVDEAIKNLSSADQVKAAIKIIRDKRFNMKSQIDKKTAIQKISKDLLKDPKVKKEMDKIYEENVEEALTLQQRMKRSRLMKRMKTRIKIGRERAKRKMANKDKLLRRARRQARDQIARKLTRGIPKKELTFARKKEIEKRLEKPALQARINRIAKRMFKDVRKAEVQRKKG